MDGAGRYDVLRYIVARELLDSIRGGAPGVEYSRVVDLVMECIPGKIGYDIYMGLEDLVFDLDVLVGELQGRVGEFVDLDAPDHDGIADDVCVVDGDYMIFVEEWCMDVAVKVLEDIVSRVEVPGSGYEDVVEAYRGCRDV